MSIYNKWYVKLLQKITKFFSKIHWNGLRALFNGGKYYSLQEGDHACLRALLSRSYYIILTQRKSHLTTPLIGILSLIKTGKWPSYTHVLMNADSVDKTDGWESFKLMEATNSGVHWSTFMQVFDCDSVCLLRPRSMTRDEWNTALDALLLEEGKKYDDLFDLADDTRSSCVEMVRNALKGNPNYAEDFAEFEKIIAKTGNLTPQMFRDCRDFEVAYEVQR